MDSKIVDREGNEFYKVPDTAVKKAQEELGILFPKSLVDFYEQIGYGFLNSHHDYFNRIMGPGSLCDFRLRKGQFSNEDDLEEYDAYEKDKLIFFEICEGYYLSIGFTKKNSGKIYDGKKKIANSLEEFLIMYQRDENYFSKK